MPESKLSTKGQIVVPKSVRDHMGIKAGDRVDFRVLESGDVMIQPVTTDIRRLEGLLKSEVRQPVPVDEMNRAIEDAHRR